MGEPATLSDDHDGDDDNDDKDELLCIDFSLAQGLWKPYLSWKLVCNKISSQLLLLIVSSIKFKESTLKNIQLFVDGKEQPWFWRIYIARYFGDLMYQNIENKVKYWAFLQAEGAIPRKQSIAWYVHLTYQYPWCSCEFYKNNGKALKKYILNDTGLRGFDTRIVETQEEHHQ